MPGKKKKKTIPASTPTISAASAKDQLEAQLTLFLIHTIRNFPEDIVGVVGLFFEKGGDINYIESSEYKNTFLHYALVNEAKKEAISAVVLHFHDKINFKIQDTNGNTILLMALKVLRQDVAVDIIQVNNTSINDQDKLGRSPLHIACILGLSDAVKHLIAANADITLRDSKGLLASDYIQGHDEEIIAVLDSVSIDYRRHPYADLNGLRVAGKHIYVTQDEIRKSQLKATRKFDSVSHTTGKNTILLCFENIRKLWGSHDEYFTNQTPAYRDMLINIGANDWCFYTMSVAAKKGMESLFAVNTVGELPFVAGSLQAPSAFFSKVRSAEEELAAGLDDLKLERKLS
jgi:hypothetical protein